MATGRIPAYFPSFWCMENTGGFTNSAAESKLGSGGLIVLEYSIVYRTKKSEKSKEEVKKTTFI